MEFFGPAFTLGAFVPAEILTGDPSCNLYWPSTTTRSPACRPEVTMASPFSTCGATVTAWILTVKFLGAPLVPWRPPNAFAPWIGAAEAVVTMKEAVDAAEASGAGESVVAGAPSLPSERPPLALPRAPLRGLPLSITKTYGPSGPR